MRSRSSRPFVSTNFTVNDFDIRYRDPYATPIVDVKAGTLRGTLKPLLHEVEVFNPPQENESLLSGLWESLVGAAAGIFENKPEAQIGTVIPLEGDVEHEQGSTWTAVVEIVKNAFFRALKPGLTEGEKEKE